MKLLVLSPRAPWPPTMADSMTVDRMLRFLADRGHTIDLVTFVESKAAEAELRKQHGETCRSIETVQRPRWRAYARTALTLLGRLPMQVQYFRSPAMRRLIEKQVATHEYDLVYTHLIRAAQYTRDLPIPKVLGAQTCNTLNLGRMREYSRDPFRRLFYGIEVPKIRRYEAETGWHFDRLLLCGLADVEAWPQLPQPPHAEVCPHGQDIPPLEKVRSTEREPGTIVITGVMSTYTNVDAATWLVREVLPIVWREFPSAKFWIVGRNPQRALRALADDSRIVVTGEVPDVYDWLRRAEVAVAPLRIASGMQNKVVQAMASELPVVATSRANEGIRGTPGEHLLVRDDPAGFADALISLLRDADERQRMGRAARQFAETHWTWEVHFERFEALLHEVAGVLPKSAP